jgi:hypothetical protein
MCRDRDVVSSSKGMIQWIQVIMYKLLERISIRSLGRAKSVNYVTFGCYLFYSNEVPLTEKFYNICVGSS